MKFSSLVAVSGALATVAAVSTGLTADDTMKAKKEKCYGVVAKGMNDCGTSAHSCAGQATEDAHPEEWIFVPAGLCDRLAGSTKEPKKKGE